MTLLRSPEEIETFIQRHREVAADLVLQEMIEGEDADHAFCVMYLDASHQVAGVVTGVTIHRYPPNLGRTASCVTRDIPHLAEAGERLLSGERYVGLAELEFKRDRRDGAYKLFEVNTRAWAYNSLAPACGADLVHLAYVEATGQPLPRERLQGRPGWTWVNTELEAGFLWETLKRGRLAVPPSHWLSPKTAHSKFSWDDPRPALHGLFYRLGRLFESRPQARDGGA